MLKNGSVADIAVAVLLCEGITNPQSMGLGGGFLATIYIKSTDTVNTLNAREVAPLAATKDMFVNKTIEGPLTIAVPGEIKGYFALHKEYGWLNWSELVEPSIKLCEEGHVVSKYLATKLKERENFILNDPAFRAIYVNPETGQLYGEGDRVKRLALAKTLRIIANEGEDALYKNGTVAQQLIKDIQNLGGIITHQDLIEYQVRWNEPTKSKLQDNTVYSSPLPGSGIVLSFILDLIQNHITKDSGLLWHRIIESFKHAYGQRTQLGDIDFLPHIEDLVEKLASQEFADEIYELVEDDRTFTDFEYYGANFTIPEDHGTANIAVLGLNGDAITVTSTINNIFGSKLISTSTGIILNDEMDDFSTPGADNYYGLKPSPANFIKPKKRPLSSMCPTIVLDKNRNVRLLIGGAGGSKITTSVAQAIVKHILLNEDMRTIVEEKRLHHQLAPMEVQYEQGYNPTILEALKSRGHALKAIPPETGFTAVTSIAVVENEVQPIYDVRRPGSTAVHRI